MNDTLDLGFIFLGWIFLDLIGLITLVMPVSKLRYVKNVNDLKSILIKKHSLISLAAELIGIILLIHSFSVPWYYHQLIDINNRILIRYFYIKDIIYLDDLLFFFIYYAYLIALILIFVKISTNTKIRPSTSLELMELILTIPGIMLIFNTKFVRCYSWIPEIFCVKSGYSSGFILYVFGITVLIINGLQISIYSRLKRKKNQTNNVKINVIS